VRQRRLNGAFDTERRVVCHEITKSIREDLETTVCEQLVESDSFVCVWIGDMDQRSVTLAIDRLDSEN
jgi:hypothetical protein